MKQNFSLRYRNLLAIPFVASIVVHLCIFLFVGSVIIFEGQIPRTLFTGEYTSNDLTVDDNMEPEMLDDTEVVEELNTAPPDPTFANPETTPQTVDSAAPELIAVDSTASPFSAPVLTGAIGDSLTSTNLDVAPTAAKSNTNISKLMFGSEKRGASRISFMGIKDESKAVAICVDVSRSMVADRRGGIKGYQTLKREVQNIINGLNEETAFTLILFSKEIDIFRQRLTPASPEAKKEAISWLEPYMKDVDSAQKGNLRRNYRTNKGVDGYGGTRMDLAVTAAFEQGADAIFIVSDGAPAIWKNLRGEEKKKLEEKRKDPGMLARRKAWYDNRKKQNDARKKKGLPPIIDESGFNGWPMPPRISTKDILDHIEKLYKELYEVNGRRPPIIHCVGYVTNAKEAAFMKKLAKDYDGKLKTIDNKDLVKKQKEQQKELEEKEEQKK